MTDFYFGVKGKSVFLSYEYLISKQVPESTIEAHFADRHWIDFKELPKQWITIYDLPKNRDEVVVLYELQKGEKEQKSLAHISLILDNAWNEPVQWKRYVPDYRKYCLDDDVLVNFCKTHALFFEIIQIKKSHALKLILIVYQSFLKAVFRTKSYKSFSNKLREAEKHGILLALLHSFKIEGRPPTKVDGFLRSRVKYFYCLPLKYSKKAIMYKVNDERLKRGLSTVSYSTIKRILAERELKNQCNPIRFGRQHAANHIYPYFNRKEPLFCDVLQIDSTRFNIPYWNHASKQVAFLVFCAIMEVNTRMILAACLDYSENALMILECMKKGLSKLAMVPRQIVVDNHKAYHSKLFKKFSNEAYELGIDVRYASHGNARDKAHIERWFGIFQTRFTNHIFGSVGEGVKTKRKGGRVAREWEEIFLKKKNLRNEATLRQLVFDHIEKYNTDDREGLSPVQKFEQASKEGLIMLAKPDIARLFYKKKVTQVRQEKVQFQHENEWYSFKIEESLASRLNDELVSLMYDPENLTSVMIFEENGREYLCEAMQDYQINMIATPEDLAQMSREKRKLLKRIEKTNQDLSREFEKGKEKLKQFPVISLKKSDQEPEQEDEELHDWMLKKAMGGKKKSNSKHKTTTDRNSVHRAKGSLKKLK